MGNLQVDTTKANDSNIYKNTGSESYNDNKEAILSVYQYNITEHKYDEFEFCPGLKYENIDKTELQLAFKDLDTDSDKELSEKEIQEYLNKDSDYKNMKSQIFMHSLTLHGRDHIDREKTKNEMRIRNIKTNAAKIFFFGIAIGSAYTLKFAKMPLKKGIALTFGISAFWTLVSTIMSLAIDPVVSPKLINEWEKEYDDAYKEYPILVSKCAEHESKYKNVRKLVPCKYK